MQINNSQSALTQECIFSALLILIKEKEFSKITITELCKKAGVSRMAFYRNYDCKEEVVSTCFNEFFSKYLKYIVDCHEGFTAKSATLYFAFFREHQNLVNCLIKSNLSSLILDSSINFLIEITKEFICDAPDNYMINFMGGGLYQVLLKWIDNGMRESDEKISELVINIMFENNEEIKLSLV